MTLYVRQRPPIYSVYRFFPPVDEADKAEVEKHGIYYMPNTEYWYLALNNGGSVAVYPGFYVLTDTVTQEKTIVDHGTFQKMYETVAVEIKVGNT